MAPPCVEYHRVSLHCVAYLHTKTPKRHSGAYFILTGSLLYLLGIMPVPLQLCHAAVWLLAATLKAQDARDLCVRDTVTRLVIYPVTLCVIFISAENFALGFRCWSSKSDPAPQYDNEATRNTYL